jgi:membrane fusion protein, heavy metal efflux system
MKKLLIFIITISLISACNNDRSNISHNHNQDSLVSDYEKEGHDHSKEKVAESYTVFSENYELFVEFSPLINGNESSFAVHITKLANHKPVLKGKLQVKLIIFGESSIQNIVDSAASPGIFRPKLKPRNTGNGKLTFTFSDKGNQEIFSIRNVTIYPNLEEAFHEVQHKNEHNKGINFTKEQAWQIEFKTQEIKPLEFNKIIKTSGEILSSQNDEIHITANTSGTFHFSETILQPGVFVKENQVLGFLSDENITDENSYTKFLNTKADFEKAKADFERAEELITKKIISEEKYQEYKLLFKKSRVAYNLLHTNYSKKGIVVKTKTSGVIKKVFMRSGEFKNFGDELFCIAKNDRIIIRADVSQNYFNELSDVSSANFKVPGGNKFYFSDKLDGKVISYGRNRNTDFLIPFFIEIDNPGDIYVGSFVETYLIGKKYDEALIISNSSIMEEQGNYFVFIQLSGETFTKRYINPDQSDGINTLVKSGIDFGERIVTEGAIRIKLAASAGTLPSHGHAH